MAWACMGVRACLLITACVSSVCHTATFALRSGHGDGREHEQEALGMIRICCAKRCQCEGRWVLGVALLRVFQLYNFLSVPFAGL